MRKRDETNYLSTAIVDPLVIGSILLLIGVVAVVISYNASRGLPFVPTFDISADVPNAAQLVAGSSEVRLGGARVGLVKEISPMPARPGGRPFARLDLALNQSLTGLPRDSVVAVRAKNVFGLKYLDLKPGNGPGKMAAGGVLPLRQSKSVVEVNDAFNVFDQQTSRGIRGTINSLGVGLAGRGQTLNLAIESSARLLPALQRVTRVLIDPKTDLAGFIQGADRGMAAFAKVAPEFASLIDKAATTLGGLDKAGPALGQTIAELPATETAATRAATAATPVLADASVITRELRKVSPLLPQTTNRLSRVLAEGTPTLRRVPQLADQLGDTLAALDQLARDPASGRSVRKLTTAVRGLSSILGLLLPAQLQCNTLGLVLNNLAHAGDEGDAGGTWLDSVPIINVEQSLQSGEPAPDLHVNYFPNANANECEAGNEPFLPGQRIGNPAGLQSNRTAETSPPAGVRSLGRKAGLIGATRGARR
jgi:virulence factor Mce-like protein